MNDTAIAVPFSRQGRAAAEETYLDVQDLLRKQVWDLVKAYGGDFDELMAEANFLFVEAYRGYRGEVPFSVWIRNWVRWALTDQIRIKLSHQQRYEVVDEHLLTKTYSAWTPKSLLEELSEDAAMIVRLVLDTPSEIAIVVSGKGGQPRNFRSTIRSYLGSIGWSAQHISETFDEIRRVLADT